MRSDVTRVVMVMVLQGVASAHGHIRVEICCAEIAAGISWPVRRRWWENGTNIETNVYRPIDKYEKLVSNLNCSFSNEFHVTWWWAHSRMCSDKIEFGSSGVIRRHKQIRLVFIGRISGRRVSGGRQSLEIKLVGVAFAVNFAHNVLIVIITAIHNKRKIAHYIIEISETRL